MALFVPGIRDLNAAPMFEQEVAKYNKVGEHLKPKHICQDEKRVCL